MKRKKPMTRAALRKYRDRISAKVEYYQKKLEEADADLKEADDAASMEIIKTSSITPEQLTFFNGLKEEEIEMILNRRKEEEIAKAEKKKNTDDTVG